MDESLEEFFKGYVMPSYIKLAGLEPEHRLLCYFHDVAEGFHINQARNKSFAREFNKELEGQEITLSTLVSYCTSLINATRELEARGAKAEDPQEAGK